MDYRKDQFYRLLSRYPVIIVLAGSLLGAVAMGTWVGSGELKKVSLILAGLAGAALVMQMGGKYWLLIPFAFTFQLQAIPIGYRSLELPEIIICVCVATFIARYALKLQKFTLFRASHTPVMLYVGWGALVFILHPVGLADAGSEVGGARYYAKLLMAFAAFLVMANQTITPRDCKWIVALVIIGSFFQSAQNIFQFFFGQQFGGVAEASLVDPDAIYTWQQSLGIVPAVVFAVVFARYKSSEIFSFSRPWIVPVLALCLLVTLLSGKRVGVIDIPLCAISAALIRKEWGFVMMWIGGAVLAMALIIVGHGTLFTLPLTVQRSLSWLPAQWDSQLIQYEGGADPFRKRMRELAMDRIAKDPWIGRGYQVDLKMVNEAQEDELNGLEAVCISLAIGSQWHNAWLGTAADFGIPAAAIYAVIYIQVTLLGLWLFKRLPAGSGIQVIAFYILLVTIRDIAGSWHSGQSATSAFDRFWMYGLLVSLAVMVKNNAKAEQSPAEVPEAAPDRLRRPLPGGVRQPLPSAGLRGTPGL